MTISEFVSKCEMINALKEKSRNGEHDRFVSLSDALPDITLDNLNVLIHCMQRYPQASMSLLNAPNSKIWMPKEDPRGFQLALMQCRLLITSAYQIDKLSYNPKITTTADIGNTPQQYQTAPGADSLVLSRFEEITKLGTLREDTHQGFLNGILNLVSVPLRHETTLTVWVHTPTEELPSRFVSDFCFTGEFVQLKKLINSPDFDLNNLPESVINLQ